MSGLDLNEVLAALQALPQDELAAVVERSRNLVEAVEGHLLRWYPNPGPQTECYECEADETLIGGEPGGGKSQVGIGLALTKHERSLLLRRTNKEASKFIGEIEEIVGNDKGYDGRHDAWEIDNRRIDFGGCLNEDDKKKYKGDPHDFQFYDELTDFTKSQYMFIKQWVRSTTPGQRCRIVASSNGPSDPQGMWVVERWAAWLDPAHHNPAQSGEIRWYLVDDSGREVEVEGPGPYMVLGRSIRATSRTFIRSVLSDNPELSATDYGSTIMAQSEENRRAFALGDFTAGMEDDPNQAIPTSWVLAATERWQSVPPTGVPMCSIGVDVAQGGNDTTTEVHRHDAWFSNLRQRPGKETPTGTEVAALALARRRDDAAIVIDVGGGWGAEAYGHLRGANIENVHAYMGVKKSTGRSACRQYTFANIRSEAIWRFREALDPNQPGGSPVALPYDRVMIADLCAPKYYVKSNGLHVEAKVDVVKRLKRSTDKGDAVVMCWWAGARMSTSWHTWPASKGNHRHMPKAILGRQPLTARRSNR